jgi:hypothetical protein
MRTRLTVRRAVIVAAVLVLCGVSTGYGDTPEHRIRVLLSEGKSAIETENLARAMSHVSPRYRDSQGFLYNDVRSVLTRSFAIFDGMNLRLGQVHIKMDGDRAVIQALLAVQGSFRGLNSYLIGSRDEMVPVTIRVAKEGTRWQVRSVEGVQLNNFDFQLGIW